MAQRGWIATWRKIAKYCDRHMNTVKTFHKRYGMPVHRFPGNIPVIIPEEVDHWLRLYNHIRKLRKKNKIKCKDFSCLELLQLFPNITKS